MSGCRPTYPSSTMSKPASLNINKAKEALKQKAFAAFTKDCIVSDTGNGVSMKDIETAFDKWCQENRERGVVFHITRRKFEQYFAEMAATTVMKMGNKVYVIGVALKHD